MAERVDIKSFDPYELNKFLIDLAENYFQTDKLDTYESGFLGYLIRSLSHLTSDVLFMNGMAYNEAFTTKAILDSSLTNLAQMFGYQYRKAIPASGTLTLEVPLDLVGFTFTIPQYARVTAGSVPYKVNRKYVVEVNDINNIRIYSIDINNLLKSVPFDVLNTGGRNYLIFDVEIIQAEFYTYNFTFPRTELYKFYKETIRQLDGNIFDLKVFVNNQQYKVIDNIYSAEINEKVVSYRPITNGVVITFGNGVFGHLPDDGDEAVIIIGVTKGTQGHIMARTAKLTEHISDDNGKAVIINSYNPLPIANAVDMETQDQLKRNIIKHISSLDRLVSKDDYFSLNNIVPYFQNSVSKSYLLRRDIHINEIVNYMVFFDIDNKPIPTHSITQEIADSISVLPKDYTFTDSSYEYVCPFRIVIDDGSKIKVVNYEYIISDMLDSPTLIESYRDELIGLNNLEFKYNGSDTLSVLFHGSCGTLIDPLDISGRIIIDGTSYDLYVDPTSTYDNLKLSSNAIPFSSLPEGITEYSFILQWQSNDHSLFKSSIIFRQPLDELVWSNYKDISGGKRVYCIPVILKEYYDDNTNYIDQYMLSRIAQYKTEMVKYHMMTDVVNIKFAKTYGQSINMRLNDYNSHAIYTYDPAFSIDIPLKISVSVVLNSDSTKTFQEIINEVKDIVFAYVQLRSKFHMDIFRSEIERYIHDTISDISYVEVTIPDREIVYSFTLDMIPSSEQEKLLSFVPEYSWIERDDIFVTVQKLSMGD